MYTCMYVYVWVYMYVYMCDICRGVCACVYVCNKIQSNKQMFSNCSAVNLEININIIQLPADWFMSVISVGHAVSLC